MVKQSPWTTEELDLKKLKRFLGEAVRWEAFVGVWAHWLLLVVPYEVFSDDSCSDESFDHAR